MLNREEYLVVCGNKLEILARGSDKEATIEEAMNILSDRHDNGDPTAKDAQPCLCKVEIVGGVVPRGLAFIYKDRVKVEEPVKPTPEIEPPKVIPPAPPQVVKEPIKNEKPAKAEVKFAGRRRLYPSYEAAGITNETLDDFLEAKKKNPTLSPVEFVQSLAVNSAPQNNVEEKWTVAITEPEPELDEHQKIDAELDESIEAHEHPEEDDDIQLDEEDLVSLAQQNAEQEEELHRNMDENLDNVDAF